MDDSSLPVEPEIKLHDVVPEPVQIPELSPFVAPTEEMTPPKELQPLHIIGLSVVILVITGIVLIAVNKAIGGSSPAPTASPSPSVVAQAVVTSTPTLTPLATSTPKLSPSPSPTPTPTPTPTTTPTPTPATTNVTLSMVAGQDGYMGSDGTGASDQDIRVGRTTTATIRGFVGFDLATLPKNAHITNAVLRVYQQSIIGDPYGVSGGSQIIVDHLDYGSSITANTYNGGNVYASNIGTISSGSQTEWKQLSVTDRVKSDLTTHTSSQYRLRLSNEAQGGPITGDYASFNSASSGYNSNPPQLTVTYY